jgi:hypothetical protein
LATTNLQIPIVCFSWARSFFNAVGSRKVEDMISALENHILLLETDAYCMQGWPPLR